MRVSLSRRALSGRPKRVFVHVRMSVLWFLFSRSKRARRSYSRSPSYDRVSARGKQSRSRSPRERKRRASRSPYSNRSQQRGGGGGGAQATSHTSYAFHTSMASELMKLRDARHRAQQREAQRGGGGGADGSPATTASSASHNKPSAKSVIHTPDVIALSDGTPSPTPSYDQADRGSGGGGERVPNNDPHHNGEYNQSDRRDAYYGPRTPPGDRLDAPPLLLPRGLPPQEAPRRPEPPPAAPFEPLPFSSMSGGDAELPPQQQQTNRRAALAQLPLPPVGSDQDSDMDIDNSPDDG